MPKSISKIPKELSPDRKLHSIIEDRTSGATEIEKKVIRLFEEITKKHQKRSNLYFRRSITGLKKRFSAMANISNLLNFVEELLEEKDLDHLCRSITAYRKNIEQNRESTVTEASRKIKSYGSIFTLSGSSLILKAIMEAVKLGWKGDIKIVESRPKNEGARFAKKTARAGIKTVLGIDAAMPDMIEASGAVFLGADAVTQTYFVNKIGSKIALEYAAKFGKPVYVVADRSKLISDKIYQFTPDKNPESEIVSRRIKNLEIVNNYFEKIAPYGKIRFICGNRIIFAPKIKNLLKRRS